MKHHLNPRGLVAALREHTAGHHKEAERAMNIMAPGLTREEYAEKLLRLYAFFAPLHRFFEASGDSPLRHYSDRLAADIEFLTGEKPEILDIEGRDKIFASLSDPYFRHGSFYVIEGSALGGQIVSRHLNQKLGISPETGGSYFFAEGPRIYQNWRRKLEELSKWDDRPEVWPAVLNGAEATFKFFASLFGTEVARGASIIRLDRPAARG
jgi:heme oxygenase